MSVVEPVAAAFGIGDVCSPPEYVARGELGHVWKVVTTDGTWAVKQLVQPVDSTAGHDVPFQLALLADGSVPMPRPVVTPAGGAVVTAGPDGAGFRAYTWVDHIPGARIEPGRAGELLARIHRVGFPADSILPWFYEPVDAAELEELARRVGPPVLDRLDDLLATLTVARADGTPPPADRLIRCHLDFVPDNVLVDAAGDPWVIDWENSGGGDPSQELAQAVLAFGGTDVLAGYEAAGGPGRLRSIDDFRMTFAVQANFLALCLRRAEGSVTHAVAAILANLVTVGDAEQLLATLH